MSGQTRRYRESLESTPGPVDPFSWERCLDVGALVSYAKERGVGVGDLAEGDLSRFVKMRSARPGVPAPPAEALAAS